MPLSSDENAQLSALGISIMRQFAAIICQVFLYGIYVCFFSYSVMILLHKPVKTLAIQLLLGLTITQLLVTTLGVASWISIFANDVLLSLVDFSLPLDLRPERAGILKAKVAPITLITQIVVSLIADIIVMWRAWVLYPGNIVARFFMVLAVLANTALMIAYCVMFSTSDELEVLVALNTTSTFLSFGTNLLATLLVGYKAWVFRRYMTQHGSRKRTTAENVILLLVETGMGFCIMQFTTAVLTPFSSTSGSPTDYAQTIIGSLTFISAGIFPVLIVIVVERTNTSIIDNSIAKSASASRTVNGSDGAENNPVSTIRFGTSDVPTRIEDDGRTGGYSESEMKQAK